MTLGFFLVGPFLGLEVLGFVSYFSFAELIQPYQLGFAEDFAISVQAVQEKLIGVV